MTEEQRFLLACALMRKLVQMWDAGGESMRSLRSVLLEGATMLAPEGLRDIDDVTHEYFQSLRTCLLANPPKGETKEPNVSLEEMSYPAFCLVVLDVLLTMHRTRDGIVARNLIAHSIVLLRPWRAKKIRNAQNKWQVKPRFAKRMSPYSLRQESRRRFNLKHPIPAY